MTAADIGTRIKALRERMGLTQDELARQFGFESRQTLSTIETGDRKVSAEELVKAAEIFGVPLETFTDPFLLIGEGKFSWRRTGQVGAARLADYETDAGRFISAYRIFAPQVGRDAPLLRHALGLNKESRFEEAAAAGERFAAEYGLGDTPALRIAEVMEREFGILVVMADPIEGVSGAACRLPELDVVLINRREAPGRRHFDLAHELFHILTWDAMPPEHVEDVTPKRRSRVEQLADAFAAAALMPSAIIARFGDWSKLRDDALITQLNAVAGELRVTSSALRWRLVDLKILDRAIAGSLREDKLKNNGRAKTMDASAPSLYSKPFVEVIARALDEGRVTVRRVSYLLNLNIDDLADLFANYGIEPPFDL